MDREASRRGYVLLLSNIHDESEQAANALRAMRGRVDGLIVMAPHLSAGMLQSALPPTLPSLFINGPEEIDDRPTVRLDNVAAMEAMVAHLVAGGRKRIVHIAGPTAMSMRANASRAIAQPWPAMRRGSNRSCWRATFPRKRRSCSPCHPRQRYRVRCRVRRQRHDGDRLPSGAAQRRSRRPRRIAVAGFDDVPLARYLGLTTVRVRIAEMGARAIERLIDILEGGPADQRAERHDAELVVRGTTAARD
ncbi:periplasmic binding protein-like domain-containing protein [Ditylenchus destructor]|uniref:Periplasmic binding protein-like domain-containing protein n=1 Tax=Ditylenchus destructor TaxID=166010 RepID=A0AAD4QS38_9BILA|nr:periplasmic binding protein-like domain-containing protein [Ditylenchus destructor]